MLLAIGRSTTTLVAGVLVLALTTSGITGYILGTIFVGKGGCVACHGGWRFTDFFPPAAAFSSVRFWLQATTSMPKAFA